MSGSSFKSGLTEACYRLVLCTLDTSHKHFSVYQLYHIIREHFHGILPMNSLAHWFLLTGTSIFQWICIWWKSYSICFLIKTKTKQKKGEGETSTWLVDHPLLPSMCSEDVLSQLCRMKDKYFCWNIEISLLSTVYSENQNSLLSSVEWEIFWLIYIMGRLVHWEKYFQWQKWEHR